VQAERLVVALPPRLVATTIDFSPGLDEDLVAVMRRTPTWMATALKGEAVYEESFWRSEGLSGLAFCDSGPLREVHDGGSADGSVAALWGFASTHHDYRDLEVGDRIEATLAQLASYFGSRAADPVRYVERNWSRKDLTNDEVFWTPEGQLPYGHPAFGQPLFDGRLAWAGAETVAQAVGIWRER
jgi:monoamine oxidase